MTRGAELSNKHVDYLKKNCDSDYDMHQLLIKDQEFFVDTAASCSFAGFEEAVDYWKNHIDPDGKDTNPDDEAALVPVHPHDVDGRCELIDGTPIHPFLAVAALGLIGPGAAVNPAKLRRYILDADSRLLDVSVSARSFPEWMRTAIHVQCRGGCESHGCDCPFHWLQTDHG